MKWKLILMLGLVAASFSSCDIGESEFDTNIQYEIAAVTNVEMPATFKFGEVNDIVVRFNNPSSCHFFSGFDVRPNLNQREVRVILENRNSAECDRLAVPQEETLAFTATSNGSYVFKFFSGLDANGQPEYLEYTVDVVE
ncbi:hypothetical protein [Nonlabens marinus]|uniref:Lipoprotein n=1 Tax=Nonlabens marinus S1-08 TaxID=1454201 RepID=W8VZL0_9FLAO|nr:hypothetical protein [Nonlabens marinus]BAO54761.1 hypothetical protein NMS_0752 [Nonlabens marinus S1-08]